MDKFRITEIQLDKPASKNHFIIVSSNEMIKRGHLDDNRSNVTVAFSELELLLIWTLL